MRSHPSASVCVTDFIGYRRITAELVRSGVVVNAKRVQRLMREDNPHRHAPPNRLRRRPRTAVTASDCTQSVACRPWCRRGRIRSGLPIYHLCSTARDIRLSRHHSRWLLAQGRGLGLSSVSSMRRSPWKQLRSGSCRSKSPNRPVSFIIPTVACSTRRPNIASASPATEVTVSMSRPGNPYDNAKAESFMKTLKENRRSRWPQIPGHQTRKTLHWRLRIDTIYNTQRLHSALGYCPPLASESNPCARPEPLKTPNAKSL